MRATDELPFELEGEAMVVSFRMIHDIIRRDLTAVRALGERVLGSATPDEVGEPAELSVSSPIWALRTYCLQYCQFVHGRHTHEDHTWFPFCELAEHLLQHLDWEEDAIFPTIRRMRDRRQTSA
jgi:hypothetical protein